MFHTDLCRHDLSQSQSVEPDPCARLAARRTVYLMYLRRRIDDPETAEDLLQDFNLKVIRAARRAAPVRNTDAWLARVLRNVLFDHYRRGDARRRAEANYAGHIEALAGPAGAGPDPTDALAVDAGLAAVETALANIRVDDAELIKALYLGGVPRHTLAQELGIEVGTLNVRAFRARKALRDAIQLKPAGAPDTAGPVEKHAAPQRACGATNHSQRVAS